MASKSLQVLLAEVPVGELRLDHNEAVEFRLFQSYKDAFPRPVLGQAFLDEPDSVWKAQSRLPAWFSNLLPEGPLRQLVAKSAGVSERKEFHLLKYLGGDLPGAVRIVARVEEWLDEGDDFAAVESAGDGPWHFSLAGVQLKLSANRLGKGLTIPDRGLGGDWILKLPDSRYPMVPHNEFATMRWAQQSGINVPEVLLVELAEVHGLPDQDVKSGEQHAFAVRRFDREDSGARVHMEDFAEAFGLFPEQKYKKVNCESLAGLAEFVRRLVFVAASGNGDAHLKNWSLLYPDGVRGELSPAYDLVSTIQDLASDKMALNFAKSKEWDIFSPEAFRRLARQIEVEESFVVNEALASAEAIRQAWASARADYGYSEGVAARIEAHMQSVPFLRN